MRKYFVLIFILCVPVAILSAFPPPASAEVINLNTVNGVCTAPPFSAASVAKGIVTRASYDIGWVDQTGEDARYYLADRGDSKGGGRVWVIDAVMDTVLFPITGFVGNLPHHKGGPNGVLVANDPVTGAKELWVGDGDSAAKWVNLKAAAIPTLAANGGSIPTGGKKRADELAYDPDHDLIIIANDADSPAFVTFIKRSTHSVLGQIKFDTKSTLAATASHTDVSFASAPTAPGLAAAGHGPNATDGIEQPIYDEGFFYISVPKTTENANGEVDKIDPVAMKVVARYPFAGYCSPHGLALGPQHHVVVGCSNRKHISTAVMDDQTGKILANITQVGGSDEVWFNPGNYRYYVEASHYRGKNGKEVPKIGVINALTNKYIKSIRTGGKRDSHSVAVNLQNDHIYAPVSEVGGIKVFIDKR